LIDRNKLFGDDIRLHAIWSDGRNLKIITSQPDVGDAGTATNKEIIQGFTDQGFEHIGGVTFYRPSDNSSSRTQNRRIFQKSETILFHLM